MAIYGGVAWPGKRPGFIVIVGMVFDKHFDNRDVYLLDEFESKDVRELVRQCGILDLKYQPRKWVGNNLNNAADRFIQEMNSEHEDRRNFYVHLTPIVEMDGPFSYILPRLKEFLNKDRKQLFLRNSMTSNYLGSIQEEEIHALEIGDFPAIEALASAVDEIRRCEGRRKVRGRDRWDDDDDYREGSSWEAG